MKATSPGHLLPAQILDPRSRVDFVANPTAYASNIPAHELNHSAFRLPAKGVGIEVAHTGSEALEAVLILGELGYKAALSQPKFGLLTSDRYRLWSAPEFLLETTEGLAKGRALCLACGAGREAITLAAEGWEVTAVDILPDALERGLMLEETYLPPGRPKIDWRVIDLRKPLPEDLCDFDLVTQLRFWHTRTKEHLVKSLKKGGTGLLECFSPLYWKVRGRPKQGWAENEWEGWQCAEVSEQESVRVTLKLPN